MKNSNKTNPDWEPCHPGMIQEAAQDSVSRRKIFQIVVGALLLAIFGGGTVFAMMRNNQVPSNGNELPGGVACITVEDHLLAFVRDEIKDHPFRTKVGTHIINCEKCRVLYDDLLCNGAACPSRPNKDLVRPPCPSKVPSP